MRQEGSLTQTLCPFNETFIIKGVAVEASQYNKSVTLLFNQVWAPKTGMTGWRGGGRAADIHNLQLWGRAEQAEWSRSDLLGELFSISYIDCAILLNRSSQPQNCDNTSLKKIVNSKENTSSQSRKLNSSVWLKSKNMTKLTCKLFTKMYSLWPFSLLWHMQISTRRHQVNFYKVWASHRAAYHPSIVLNHIFLCRISGS